MKIGYFGLFVIFCVILSCGNSFAKELSAKPNDASIVPAVDSKMPSANSVDDTDGAAVAQDKPARDQVKPEPAATTDSTIEFRTPYRELAPMPVRGPRTDGQTQKPGNTTSRANSSRTK